MTDGTGADDLGASCSARGCQQPIILILLQTTVLSTVRRGISHVTLARDPLSHVPPSNKVVPLPLERLLIQRL